MKREIIVSEEFGVFNSHCGLIQRTKDGSLRTLNVLVFCRDSRERRYYTEISSLAEANVITFSYVCACTHEGYIIVWYARKGYYSQPWGS